jgi:(p)ppGpp synthase/HD superfamily hydrolase
MKRTVQEVWETLTYGRRAWIDSIKEYGKECHSSTNHLYDGNPYSVHLELVFKFACEFSHLITEEKIHVALASAWTHDTIEDTRQTYNDVKKACGEEVAEVVYALTNEKGKNRKERANDKYYLEMRKNKIAVYVKLCDRLANLEYSSKSGSRMSDLYKKEHEGFVSKLYFPEFEPMYDEMKKYF